jgi:hypothetical protein
MVPKHDATARMSSRLRASRGERRLRFLPGLLLSASACDKSLHRYTAQWPSQQLHRMGCSVSAARCISISISMPSTWLTWHMRCCIRCICCAHVRLQAAPVDM